MDKEQLKLHISSIQSEIDRIQALLSDYIGDIITVGKDRNVQFYKEAVWKLADNLTAAFQLTTSNNAKEILSQLLTHTTLSDNDQLLYDILYELQDIES
ncbi:18219_t:CDS:2, partial [Dentiscutata erythropus]